MRTVFVGRYEESETLSGPEKVAKRIYHEYLKTDKSIFIQYFFDGNKYSVFKKLFGYEKTESVTEPVILRLGIFRFLIFLFRHKPSNVHLITYERFALVVFIHKLIFRVRVIYNVHGIIVYEDKYLSQAGFFLKAKNNLCEKVFIRCSDILVFLSQRSLKNAEQFYPVRGKKEVIIPNGIDKIFYENSRDKKINFNDNLKIAFYGNLLRKEKGLFFLLECLKESGIDTDLFVISDSTDIIAAESDKIKIHTVDMMNAKALSDFYKDKDVFVSASYYEQFSIAAAEAAASGLTAIVTEESGISEYLTDGVNGFKFNYGDKKMFVKILTDINNDRQILKKVFGNSGVFYNSLTWDSVFKKYSALYA